jgi:hypothetical protein
MSATHFCCGSQALEKSGLAPRQRSLKKQRGFVGYAIASAALMVALGAASIKLARTSANGDYVFNTTNATYAAGVLIQTKIRYCPLAYPVGNNGTGFSVQYPGAATAVLVSTLVCPGRASVAIFNGGDGVFLPVTPNGFTGWYYVNDASGVRVYLTSDGTSARNKILTNVAAKFTSSAATHSANTLTLWIKK